MEPEREVRVNYQDFKLIWAGAFTTVGAKIEDVGGPTLRLCAWDPTTETLVRQTMELIAVTPLPGEPGRCTAMIAIEE